MHIHSNNEVRRIYNVIGTLRGTVEPGKIMCLQHNLREQWPLHVFHGYNGEMRNRVFSEILYCMIFEMVFTLGFIWFRVCQHFHCKGWFSRGSHNQDGSICLQASNFAIERIFWSGYSPLRKTGMDFAFHWKTPYPQLLTFCLSYSLL